MSWVAVAIAGAAVVGGVASQDAASKQSAAADKATQQQVGMYNQGVAMQAPYRAAGQTALADILYGQGLGPNPTGDWKAQLKQAYQDVWAQSGQLSVNPDVATSLFKAIDSASSPTEPFPGGNGETVLSFAQRMSVGAPANLPAILQSAQQGQQGGGAGQGGQGGQSGLSSGQLTHSFNASDLNANLAPNYAFMLSQGQGATSNMASLGGGLLSGNTLKAIQDYTQNYAGNAYQQAYENYNTNQTNVFNRLASVAGLGQTASGQSQASGANFSGGIAGTIQGAAAARAAGSVGTANAVSGGLTGAASWYALPQIMNGNNTNNSNSQYNQQA